MNSKLLLLIFLNFIIKIHFGDSYNVEKEDQCTLGDEAKESMRKLKPRIVGGYEVYDISQFPYQAEYGYNCAGAILGHFWVITAAHCGKKKYVKVGSIHLDKGEEHFVDQYYPHPKWIHGGKPHAYDMDLLLLKLKTALQFGRNIYPIKLGNYKDMKVGQMLTVSGWGSTYYTSPLSETLRAVQLPVASKSKCQRISHPYFRHTLTNNMFCAGYEEGNKDACQGDSGGPAVTDNRLYGIVSFGFECATPGYYGVYVKVGVATQWMESITQLSLT